MRHKKTPTSGFVYIWRDRKHKRYYIGSHWGTPDDGYICSSPWMRQAYKHRPLDFKRRVLNIVENRNELYDKEQYWFDFIKQEEIGKRYYNLTKKAGGHWSANPDKRLEVTKKLQGRIYTTETRKKMSESARGNKNCLGRKASEESKEKMSLSHKGQIPWSKGKKLTNEHKEKMSIAKIGKTPWNKGLKGRQIPWNKGKEHSAEHRANLSIAAQARWAR